MAKVSVHEWFQRREKQQNGDGEEPKERPVRNVPDGVWIKCPSCRFHRALYHEELSKNLMVCPHCGHHFPMEAGERIAMLVDGGTFQETDAGLTSADPLNWGSDGSYVAKLEKAQGKTGMQEAVVTGRAEIAGHPVIIGAMDFRFMGASMGSAVGEKIARVFELAIEEKRAVVLVVCSGGARMQESMLSLMQMRKTSAAATRLNRAGLPYVVVMTHPTYGGTLASFPFQANVILAEPKARIGFAGPEVIKQTTHEKLPQDFQTAEFLLSHGHVDAVVPRKEQHSAICCVLNSLLSAPVSQAGDKLEYPPRRVSQFVMPFERHLVEKERELGQLVAAGAGAKDDVLAAAITDLEARVAAWHQETYSNLSAWEKVQVSRHPDRPRAHDYLEAIFGDVFELHGDRMETDDPAIVAALATIGGHRVVVIGHRKGWDTKSSLAFRFGMPIPEGYRKVLRVMKLAERFGLPIITLIDTAGAYSGVQAEEHAQAWAISACVAKLSELTVPVVSIVIGEGGSGGALALGPGDRLIVLENGYYSVISPEGCATIMQNDAAKAAEVAESLKLTAQDLLDLGIADEVIPEPFGGAHRDPHAMYPLVASAIRGALADLMHLDPDELVAARYARIRSIGVYTEGKEGSS